MCVPFLYLLACCMEIQNFLVAAINSLYCYPKPFISYNSLIIQSFLLSSQLQTKIFVLMSYILGQLISVGPSYYKSMLDVLHIGSVLSNFVTLVAPYLVCYHNFSGNANNS